MLGGSWNHLLFNKKKIKKIGPSGVKLCACKRPHSKTKFTASYGLSGSNGLIWNWRICNQILSPEEFFKSFVYQFLVMICLISSKTRYFNKWWGSGLFEPFSTVFIFRIWSYWRFFSHYNLFKENIYKIFYAGIFHFVSFYVKVAKNLFNN